VSVVVGLGCRPGVEEAEVRTLLATVLRRHHMRVEDVLGYATVEARADEPALRAVAGPGLLTFPAEELAHIPVPNPSALTLESVGTASVAEAAALRAATLLAPRGAEVRLIEPKLAGTGVTVALALVSG
jgi:cobalamin biosynthesis protein CbiG